VRIAVLLVTFAAAAPRLAYAQALPARQATAPAPAFASCAVQASRFAPRAALGCMGSAADTPTVRIRQDNHWRRAR
jgi:hypothetical protein